MIMAGIGLVLALVLLGGVACLLSGAMRRSRAVDPDALARDIDALLPQTQCEACGYPGCRPYADAVAAGSADINKCAPGGTTTVRRLAELLGRAPKAPEPERDMPQTPALAYIREPECIGCLKCVRACPVDAILGAPGQMHTVIPGDCTGCELCIAPCPVDCIEMRTRPRSIRGWSWPLPALQEDAA